MQGLPADFGYEFVDGSWILDFSQKPETAQPWMTAERALTGAAPSPIGATSPKQSAGARLDGPNGTAASTLGSDSAHGQNRISGGAGNSLQRGPPTGPPLRL